jgi:hypothetical protein
MKRFADKESEDLQREADAKATPEETWQALFEEGEEQGDWDADNGVDDTRYLSTLKALQMYQDTGARPLWQGYVKGYKEHKENEESP